MKTPLNNLVDEIDLRIEDRKEKGQSIVDLEIVKSLALRDMKKEKEIFVDTYNQALRNCKVDLGGNKYVVVTAEDYYNETFK